MNAQAQTNTATEVRAHWYAIATRTALLDCGLLHLLPWETDSLKKLPPDLYPIVLRKLDELVTEACRHEAKHGEAKRAAIGRGLMAELWKFLEAWNRSPDVPPYAVVSNPEGVQST